MSLKKMPVRSGNTGAHNFPKLETKVHHVYQMTVNRIWGKHSESNALLLFLSIIQSQLKIDYSFITLLLVVRYLQSRTASYHFDKSAISENILPWTNRRVVSTCPGELQSSWQSDKRQKVCLLCGDGFKFCLTVLC